MENPLLPCKPKDPIPNLLNPHQNPIQIPSKPIQPTPLPAQKSSQPLPTATHRSIDRQLSLLCRNGKLQEAISALEQGSPVRPRTYISLLQSCIDSDSIDHGRRLHASIGTSVQELNPFIETKLVSMYAKCGSLEEARRVFYEMRERNLFTWSAMINGYARQQLWEEVVKLFFQMMDEGVIPDSFLLPKILQACANTEDAETGKLLHSLAVRSGFLDTLMGIRVSNSILAMYTKCGQLTEAKIFFAKMGVKDLITWNSIISGCCQCGENEEALRLLEQMRAEGIEPGLVTWNILIASYNQSGKPELAMELMKQMESSGTVPDVFTWTSMISGSAQNNKTAQALDLFHDMQLSGVEPDRMTAASVVSACASLKNLKDGKGLHSYTVKIGGASNMLVGNSLIDMYAKCGNLEDAFRVFDLMPEKDVFTWNSIIGGYMQAGYCGKAYDLFSKMENLGVQRNVVTWNTMISGYCQNGYEEHAIEIFQKMETEGVRRNTASWNALITGLLQNGHPNKALGMFRQMQAVSARPNSITILSILPACGNLVSAWKVKEIHACILHNTLQSNISIGNALLDAYSKSGDIGSAQAIFDGLSPRDNVSWNSLIAASVLHGDSHVAQDLFYQMTQEGIKPNQATFASMINAYGLSRMVNEGKELFFGMIEDYQLSPGLEHYRGMVELYGRSGSLSKASDFIGKMPMEPDFSVWDALLTAARIYGNIKLANLAAENMIKLEPRNVRTQKLLSVIHALNGRLTDVSKVRKPKKESKVNGLHGCCWIEARNKVHTFLTGEQPIGHSDSKYSMLIGLRDEIKISVPNSHDSNLDVEEEREEIVGMHSEKLAIAFALVNTPTFRSIRIVKSVRMCRDCHTTAKLISMTYQREILLKDPKCLHYFKDGKCSCRDYW